MFPNLSTVVGEGNWGILDRSPFPFDSTETGFGSSLGPGSPPFPTFPCLRATSLRVPCASLRFSQSDVSSSRPQRTRLSSLCTALLRGFQTSLGFWFWVSTYFLIWIMSAVSLIEEESFWCSVVEAADLFIFVIYFCVLLLLLLLLFFVAGGGDFVGTCWCAPTSLDDRKWVQNSSALRRFCVAVMG